MPFPEQRPAPTPSPELGRGRLVIDAPLRSALDRVSTLVSRLLGASMVTFVLTADGQHYVTASNVGLGETFADFPLPLTGSLCEHVITTRARFATNTAGAPTGASQHDFGPSYAGIRLVGEGGEVLGALCALDDAPRVWSHSELAILADFAGLVRDHLTFDDDRR